MRLGLFILLTLSCASHKNFKIADDERSSGLFVKQRYDNTLVSKYTSSSMEPEQREIYAVFGAYEYCYQQGNKFAYACPFITEQLSSESTNGFKFICLSTMNFLGVQTMNYGDGVSVPKGLVVFNIPKTSPNKDILRRGDVITQINNISTLNTTDLLRATQYNNQQVPITVYAAPEYSKKEVVVNLFNNKKNLEIERRMLFSNLCKKRDFSKRPLCLKLNSL